MEAKDQIAGAINALAIIEAFDEEHQRLSTSAMAERTGLSRTATRRYLLTLKSQGYLETDGKLYWLSPRVVRLGAAYFRSARLPRVVQPFLQQLTNVLQESALLAVLDGDNVVYVARNAANRIAPAGFFLGSTVPAPLSSAGMAMLAYHEPKTVEALLNRYEPPQHTAHTFVDKAVIKAELSKIKQLGYAYMERQIEANMCGVAVPLKNFSGNVIGALSVSMVIDRDAHVARTQRVLHELQTIAGLLRAVV